MRTWYHNSLKKILIVLTIFCVVSSTHFVTTAQQAHAVGGGVVKVVGGTGTMPQIATEIKTGALVVAERVWQQKDLVLDYLLWNTVNIIIEQMAASLVDWINSGYEGSPTFALDVQDVLEKAAIREVDRFLGDPSDKDNPLGFFCSPFNVDIAAKLKLVFNPIKKEERQCGVEDIVKNIYDANLTVNGERLKLKDVGGWDGWYRVTAKQGNNPYGALVSAEADLALRIKNAKGEEHTLLDFGNGFRSMKQCDGGGQTPKDNSPVKKPTAEDLDPFGGAGANVPNAKKPVETCEVTTPGKVLEGQLNKNLGIPLDRLAVADEIDEVISAFMQRLVTDVFNLGLSNYDAGSAGGKTESGSGNETHELQEYYDDYLESVGLGADDLTAEIQFCDDPK
ncbi:MAG: hypothetical protein LR017_01790, partial [Candidatus Pacebacteria bacterium]|nr:hypothetical protein [Candidatus Paceibacterota bacterium]